MSSIVVLGSDIGNTTPGGENRKFSQVSFYIINIGKLLEKSLNKYN